MFSSPLFAQRITDFSLWTWNQVYYHIDKSHYASFQYQSRFNENASQFDCANLYFIYGYNPNKKSNLEFLYQLKTDNRKDLHTLYLGYTRKIKVRSINLYARIAFQHNRNFFSMNEFYDQSYNELRFRIRAKYDFNKVFSMSLSAEPTFVLSRSESPYIDKLRYVWQTSMQYNKFNAFTLFYIYQPDIYTFSAPETNYVLGIAYEISLRGKVKSVKKFIKPDIKLEEDSKDNGKNHPDNL
ncbi:MAG: DUF2490 domain-containing protein [Bacteroidota bacterium]